MEGPENVDNATPQQPFPLPDIVCTNKRHLEREDVMSEMRPILVRLRGKWTEELAQNIAEVLTPQKLRVMEPKAKGLLAGWIYQQGDDKYLQWLEDAEEDTTAIVWDEETLIPGPEYWSSVLTMTTMLDDLDQAVEALGAEQRSHFQQRLLILRGFVVSVEWHRWQKKKLPVMDSHTLELLRRNEGIKSRWTVDRQT